MSWRVRPEEIHLEMSRLSGSKQNVQMQIYDFLRVYAKENHKVENHEYGRKHLNHSLVRKIHQFFYF